MARKKLGKNVIALSLASFFNDVGSEMIFPLLPIFITEVLKASSAVLGAIEGVAESLSSITKLVSGYIADKAKKKPFVAAGYTLSAVSKPAMAAAGTWHVVMGLRTADRLGKGVRTPARDALLAASVPEESRGFAFGFHRAMDHLGALVGPLLAFGLLNYLHIGLRTLFFLSIIPSLFVLAAVLFMVEEVPAKRLKRLELSVSWVDRNFALYLAGVFFFSLGNASDAFILLKAKLAGIALASLPLVWAGHNLVKSLFSTHLSGLSDKIGRKKVILLGYLLYFLTYSGFALAGKASVIVALILFYGFFFAAVEGTEKAFVADLSPEERRAAAYGLYHFVVAVGILPASVLFGYLWKALSPAHAFFVAAGFSFLGLLLVSAVREKS